MIRFLLIVLSLILAIPAPAQDVPPPDQPQRIGPAIHAPTPLKTPDAEMPDEARMKQQNGMCVISIIVDVTGEPTNPRIVRCSDPMFEKNTTAAVMRYKFKPAFRISDGKPVAVILTVEVNFRFGYPNHDRVEPPTQIRYAFFSPPGMTSSEPDGEGFYPLSKLLEEPKMTEFVSKGFGAAALQFPDGTGCDLVLRLNKKGKPLNAIVSRCDKPVLETPAIESLMKSKYKPAKMNGTPVPVRMAVRLVYDGFGPHKTDGSVPSGTSARP